MDPLYPASPRPAAPLPRREVARFIGRSIVVLLPAAVLALGVPYGAGDAWLFHGLGAGLLGFFGLILLPQPRLSRPTTGLAVVALYILGLIWLWCCNAAYHQDWYPHLAVGLLMAVPLVLFAFVTLVHTGARDLRRARLLVRQLLRRSLWPEDLNFCQTLPEVLALREAVQGEAAPVLALLAHPKVEIRVSALAALAYRNHWRPGQAELVQHLAHRASEPPVRAAAVRALALSRDPFQVETLAKTLRDPDPEARRAAAEVLFSDGERRWGWVRFSVHEALADANLAEEGPLPLGGVVLPPQAISDLNEWASEGGVTTVRATQTLVSYYSHILNTRADRTELAAELRGKVLDRSAPTTLRVELAQLLFEQHLLDRDALEGLLSSDHPVPLRLLAADTILLNESYPRAADTLRSIARMPNREIALAVAQIIQRRLGVDVGVDLHKLPAPQSRAGAEVTRRVMQWAAQVTEESAAPPTGGTTTAAPAPQPDSDWDLPPLPPRQSGGNSGQGFDTTRQ
jgi:hypothetical protein